MTTCGMPCSSFAMCPAAFAYQVCECTRSAPAASWAIARSVPSVVIAGLAAAQLGGDAVRECSDLVAGSAEAAHQHLGVAAERLHQFGDVHPRSSIDFRRIFTGEQVDAHAATLGHQPALIQMSPRIGKGMPRPAAPHYC